MKRFAIYLLTILLVVTATQGACSRDARTPQEANGTIQIALVLTEAGLGDLNFCDMAYEGLLRAQEAYGIQFDYAEPKTTHDYPMWFERFAASEKYDLIIGLGYDQRQPLLETARQYPKQRFSIIDPEIVHPMVHAIAPKRQDQTFLSGVIAGLATQSEMEGVNDQNIIGIIIGQSNPDILDGVAGFEAGARFVNPAVEIMVNDTDSFQNPAIGREVALTMYSRGADIIQHLAGATGLGVFAAARETGYYAFGVGGNQNHIEPDHVLGTAIRNVDELVFDEVVSIINGRWESGVDRPGLSEGVVGFSRINSHVEVPQWILDATASIHDDILNGSFTPPTMEELDRWLQNHRWGQK